MSTDKIMWWGYLHQNGGVQLKRWFGDVKDYTEDCEGNEFVQRVVEPFPAETHEEAMAFLCQKLGRPTPLDTQFIQSFNRLAAVAHGNSRAKGFWSTIDSLRGCIHWQELEVIWKLSRIALIHSEASEALGGIRKDLNDDHLPNRKMEVAELADVVIRILTMPALTTCRSPK